VAELLAGSYTDGFMVLHQGRVITEQYFNGMKPETPHLLMSVSKSIVGALAGILADRGVLDVEAAAEVYAPELARTSFAGATVRQLLDMRTGTRFSEDYTDLNAEVRSYERVYLWRPGAPGEAVPPDALSYFATLVNDGEHGGPFRYRSILTDVLAWVLERAAGDRLHRLVARELWQPMGAEFDAEITLDAHGNPMADGGISATLRDLARFGLLFAEAGRAGPRQVVPGWWVTDTIRGAADGPAAFVAAGDAPGYPEGAHYRNCWWVRDPSVPFFHASGINGQHVFVHLPTQTVVVKLSTWPVALSTELVRPTVAAVLAIAQALGG
jgi:CubicO group peptidase (beta-lactamase class C family)